MEPILLCDVAKKWLVGEQLQCVHCVAVRDDLGEYICSVTDGDNVTVTKPVNLWCKYQPYLFMITNLLLCSQNDDAASLSRRVTRNSEDA